MSGAAGDVDGVSAPDGTGTAIERNLPFATYDKPVLRPARVGLVAESLSDADHDGLDLEAVALSEDGVVAPGARVGFRHIDIVPDRERRGVDIRPLGARRTSAR